MLQTEMIRVYFFTSGFSSSSPVCKSLNVNYKHEKVCRMKFMFMIFFNALALLYSENNFDSFALLAFLG